MLATFHFSAAVKMPKLVSFPSRKRDDGDVDFYSFCLNSPLILIQSNKPNTSSGSFIHFTFGNFDEWFQKKEQRELPCLERSTNRQDGRFKEIEKPG